jgi:hypothetical protein
MPIFCSIGTGYQRQQGGINIADIVRLNEQLGGGGGKKPSARSPKAGAVTAVGTPARRRAGGLSPLPPLQIGDVGKVDDAAGAGGPEGEIYGGRVEGPNEEQKGESESDDEKDENARGVKFQNPAESEGDEDKQIDRASNNTPSRSAWNKDISSMKYSTKYTQWQFSSTANIPDYIKSIVYNNTSSKDSSKVAPAAYKVKNFKQRNIVLRVVIHFAKKLNPRRLLVRKCLSTFYAQCLDCVATRCLVSFLYHVFAQHFTFRGYRRVKKFCKHHFTNPDGLTPSERDKLATIRKLDLLTQDASTIEYHKSIVNLAGTVLQHSLAHPLAEDKHLLIVRQGLTFSHGALYVCWAQITRYPARSSSRPPRRSGAYSTSRSISSWIR